MLDNIYDKENRTGFLFFFFTIVFFLTPNFPMPTSAFGPIGPGSYLLVLGLFFLLGTRINFSIYRNQYFKVILVLTFLLALSDILKIFVFEPEYEINFILIRIVNFGIFFIYGQFLIFYDNKSELFSIRPFFLKVYYYSVLFISFILYGQALGFINIGAFYNSRTYFGIKLPFNKPVGIFELSDGKLGIIIAPVIFLCLINALKKYRFFKVKFGFLIAFILSFLIFILQSRSGYLALVIAFGFFILLFPSRKFRIYSITTSIIATVLIVASGAYRLIYAGLVGEGIYERNVEARGSVLANVYDKFLSSPIIGVGHKGVLLYHDTFSSHGVGVHNQFSDHLATGGLLAFIPFVLLFVLFFYVNLKVYFLSLKKGIYQQTGLSIWLMVSMVYIIIELFFYRGFYNEYLYFFLALGTISYLNQQKLTNEKNIAHS